MIRRQKVLFKTKEENQKQRREFRIRRAVLSGVFCLVIAMSAGCQGGGAPVKEGNGSESSLLEETEEAGNGSQPAEEAEEAENNSVSVEEEADSDSDSASERTRDIIEKRRAEKEQGLIGQPGIHQGADKKTGSSAGGSEKTGSSAAGSPKTGTSAGGSGKTEVSRVYVEDCGADTGYWDITYSDGTHEYLED